MNMREVHGQVYSYSSYVEVVFSNNTVCGINEILIKMRQQQIEFLGKLIYQKSII